MGRYNFAQDLAIAKLTEAEVGQLYVNQGADSWKLSADHRTSDIEVCWSAEHSELVEVKEDFMVAKTGNVAVEYECRGKPSGIATSTAVWWVYKLHESGGGYSYHELPTLALRLMCYDGKYRHVVGGDKYSGTKLVLIPVAEFKEASHKLAEVPNGNSSK